MSRTDWCSSHRVGSERDFAAHLLGQPKLGAVPERHRPADEEGRRSANHHVRDIGFSCYSGCRQYRENIAAALQQPGAEGLQIDKLRVFYNHPDFVSVVAEQVGAAIAQFPEEERNRVRIAFTAHSIPMGMAKTSDYEKQLKESCRLVAEALGVPSSNWDLVYQSRSGRPEDPWLEPDILDHLRALKEAGHKSVVISPVGFLSDHMEVLYDLDDEAKKLCDAEDIHMVRAATPGNHPRFITMIRKLIEERNSGQSKECVGLFPANHDVCPTDCCPAPVRPPARSGG